MIFARLRRKFHLRQYRSAGIIGVVTRKAPQYALVAYVRNSMGRFVESMRRDLHPDHSHLPAHITILPPRTLAGTEAEAIADLRARVPHQDAFKVVLGEVETFHPTTPTVFIRVARSAHRIREMHEALNEGTLEAKEQWPFMPHLTIVKMPELKHTPEVLSEARRRWAEYGGPREVEIRELTFVREGENNQWIDLETITLREPVPATR
jgi:2'-5' RNA ligase